LPVSTGTMETTNIADQMDRGVPIYVPGSPGVGSTHDMAASAEDV
jgi:hypothetical protein